MYALSDPKENKFKDKCDHEHNDSCDRCDDLKSTLSEIESALTTQTSNLLPSAKEELTFVLKQSKVNILAWKSHILRCIHQDAARIDVLENLDESSVLIFQDWAMKYLPRKFRESQTDWFGKRGIPWHISVVFRKVNSQLEMLTFVHVFNACTQDYCAVLAIMADVIKQLKAAMPSLKTVHYRQDNAGCYHSGPTIICASKIGAELGVKIKRLDFSDPQGGKAACDRKAATIKAHMHLHLNSGHDIETPTQMCEAMLSSDGIPSLNVTVCDSVSIPAMPSYKLEGVSTLYNIEYKNKGMSVWKAYGVGKGTLRSEFCSSKDLPSVNVVQSHPSVFSPVKSRKQQSTSSKEDDQPDKEQEQEFTSGDALFTCPEEGCIRTFMRHSSMMQHLDCGKHQRALERETLYDKAALEYAEQLEGQATSHPQAGGVRYEAADAGVDKQPMGWALKSRGASARFTDKQKAFLTAKFRIGEETGIKSDPTAVARSMMFAKDPDGSLIFKSDDFLTSKQIAGFFSRLAAKKTLQDDVLIEDVEIAVHEAELEAFAREVEQELTLNHPIVFEAYNLCELNVKKKLDMFSMSVLINICSQFGIDTTDIKSKRVKKPYVSKLQSLCQGCECQQ